MKFMLIVSFIIFLSSDPLFGVVESIHDTFQTHLEIPMISSFKAVSLGELGLTKPPRTAFGNFVAALLDTILMRYDKCIL